MRAVLAAGVVTILAVLPGSTPASVTPATIIEQQVIKPNMLIVFDTSTSMMSSPGNNDMNTHEVGPDCDDGNDYCRFMGTPGRCYWTGAGAMGAGIQDDNTSCHNDNECKVGYCRDHRPKSCDEDSDCSGDGLGQCKGYCSNNNNKPCTGNAACSGGTCMGLCTGSMAGAKMCTTDADCGSGEPCATQTEDFCVNNNNYYAKVKMCQVGQNRCRTDADCTAPGDTCGKATSRMVIAKRVVSSVVAGYHQMVNFGLMTYYQQGFFPYYEATGAITEHEIVRFLVQEQLETYGCWTGNDGPAPSCKINGETYNRRATNDSRYHVKTGGDTFVPIDNKWCGTWCSLASGTGYFVGSYYTTTDPRASSLGAKKVMPTYVGKTFNEGGKKYVYWNTGTTSRNYEGVFDRRPSGIPIGVPSDAQCGLGDLVPFLDTTSDKTKQRDLATAIMARMDKASFGGVFSTGSTPTGCTLWEKDTPTDTNNALSYMTKVKANDALKCRNNYVLLVTDGRPNGSGDVACDSAACASDTLAGCTCQTVLAAAEMKKKGIFTYAVGFSDAISKDAYGKTTLENVAKAGGTTKAYFAAREAELESSIINVIYDAAKGSYSTSPAAASQGTQQTGSVKMGDLLLDTRVDFPGWTGNLIAYDTSGPTPTLAWNARTVSFDPAPDAAGPDFWKKRNLWTSDGTTMVKFDVDPTTGVLKNKTKLRQLGLGATDDEAERIARWMLGDPAMKNPAVLGAMLNSTPIDVGPPGKSALPGGVEFYNTYINRPHLTYVGASDGMLHAFFTKDVTVSGIQYKAGKEAFAYIPQNMLSVATKLFAQGGQKPDPADHIYGLANSAKVKSLCTANCTGQSGTPVWKTILVMTYGWGGTEAFMLDITWPFGNEGVKTASAPTQLMWHTQYMNNSSTSAYNNALGLTTSVPAFYYAKDADKNDFRIIFGSYSLDDATGNVAKVLINSSVQTGAMTDNDKIQAQNNCDQSFGLMSDVATAKNFSVSEEGQLVAGYFGDTWGNLYRYVPGVDANLNTLDSGSVSTVEALTCSHPIHYAPTIVQLDRDLPNNRPGEIYIVQVTNSALDLETKSFPASKMVIRRDIHKNGVVTPDATFGTAGKITLTAGVANELCGVTDDAGTSCKSALPAGARPNATPMGVVRQDGTGFLLLSTWYLPPVDACKDGVTYLAIHEWTTTAGIKQRFAMELASEPVTSVAIVNGKLLFATQSGVTDLTGKLPNTIRFTQNGITGERMTRTGWSEKP
jgi:Neisseria PilC beta-propeller domain